MRLIHRDGRVLCGRGVRKKHDRVLEHKGCPTLLLTEALADDLSGRTLDAPKTKRGRRLQLRETD
jgi:hypothetical protein